MKTIPLIFALGTSIGLLSSVAAAQSKISAGNFTVVQMDTNNTVDSVEVSATLSINSMMVRGGSNRGDFNLQVGEDDYADDVDSGVMLASVAENGRDNGEDAFPRTNFCTSTTDYSRSGANAGGYFVSIFNSPAGSEYNINFSAAFFPYTNWLCGFARNSGETNGGANNLFSGSPGLVPGVNFVELGGGKFVVDLRDKGVDSRTDGVLLVCHGKNEDNFATAQANSTNGTWLVWVKDNGSDGTASEQDPVAFVFVPKTNNTVISGKFRADGTRLIYNGETPLFAVTNVGTGIWRLSIPHQTPKTGVLILSAEGGGNQNSDNIVSYQPDGDDWLVQSRDLPGSPPSLQSPANDPVASFVFIPTLAATLVSPADDAANIGVSPTLKVAVPSPVAGKLTVTFYGRPLPIGANTNDDFTVAVLPDTQFYSAAMHGGTPAMFQSQTDWLVKNRTNLNLAFVSHLGDITQNGQNSGNNAEWLNATNAMYRLENPIRTLLSNGIPYGMGVGNHDQTPIGTGDDGDTSFFNQFFGVDHFIGYDYYGGHYGANNNNSFQFFSAGGMDFIFIHFEYDTTPKPEVLAWADNLLKTYPHRRAIVTSHWIVNTGFNASFSDQGRAIYDALKDNANFTLMLCGHVAGEGQRHDTYEGRTVYSILTDYQGRTNGGNGWMRYYVFSPRHNVVQAYTYSPWLDKFETDADSQFEFAYDMNVSGTVVGNFIALATNVIQSGNSASYLWSGISPTNNYEWYVEVRNEFGDVETSPIWHFSSRNVAPVSTNQSRIIMGDTATNLLLAAGDANGDLLMFETNSLPVHGLLLNFDATAGQVTYQPVRGFRGTDRFTYSASDGLLRSSVASMNLTVMAPTDTDGNGLPDAWEMQYGVHEPEEDFDGDGKSNLEEYWAGTNPTNRQSVFQATNMSYDVSNSFPVFSWASVGGVRYRVQYSNGSANGGFTGTFTDLIRSMWLEVDTAPNGTPSSQTFIDDFSLTGGSPSGNSRFYRVKIIQ